MNYDKPLNNNALSAQLAILAGLSLCEVLKTPTTPNLDKINTI